MIANTHRRKKSSFENFFLDASGAQGATGMTAGRFDGAAQGGATQPGGVEGGAPGTSGGSGGGSFEVSSGYGGVGCPFGEKELGMENGKIQDNQVTSSSDWGRITG